ncbi:MAG: nucleotidyltransferase family protein [Pseudomonadota bacterium]
MDAEHRPWTILLAAGGSTRLGRPKQLVKIDGTPLVRRACARLGAACGSRVICVLGAHADAVREALRGLAVRCIVNGTWEAGMASSVACGVAAVPKDAASVLVATCDQYRLEVADFHRLLDVAGQYPDRLVASAYGGVIGVPAVFPRRLFPALRALTGDRGARAVIRDEPDAIAVPMPGASVDLDTADDLAAAQE